MRNWGVFAFVLVCLAASGGVLLISRQQRAVRFEQIMEAAAKRDYALAERLVDRLPNINLRDADGVTILGHAAHESDAELVRIVLDHHAEVDPEHQGMTPLALAANSRRQSQVVAMLLSRGANPKHRARDHLYTPLHFAANRGNVEAVRLLIASGADPDAVAKDGNTPLHMAAAKCGFEAKSVDVARLLLEAGAHPSRRNSLGLTPYDKSLRLQQSHPAAKARLKQLHAMLRKAIDKGP
jgi:uncharacterized protein